MINSSKFIVQLRLGVVMVALQCAFVVTRALAVESPVKPDADNAQWAVVLEGFFPGQTKGGEIKRLNCYLVRSGGKWVTGLGTATNQGRANWNTAMMLIDPANAIYKDGKLTGTLAVTLVPDPWVPKDQKTRQATVTLDAAVKLEPGEKSFATLSGTWSATIAGGDEELAAASLQAQGAGKISGTIGLTQPRDLADVSYDLAIYDLIPGKAKDNFQRRRALSLGIKDGKPVSARLGQMDMRHNAYDYETIGTPQEMKVNADHLSTTVSFSADTLDGHRANFALALEGRRVSNFVAGTYKGTYTGDDGKLHEISGYFRGNVKPGAFESATAVDDRPWFKPVKGFVPPQAGEHPRLFFGKSYLPELRRRAATDDGKLIIKRLRQLLNGGDGESMPTVFNPAKLAYEKNGFKAAPGAYSISTAAGFGFLYQLSGDKKYAELARQCVEKAFAGQRDFDDRYAWVAPGGELRAGPSIAWTAVAYDLCYDGWDEAFRTQVAKAIQNYADTRGGEWNNPEAITLREMVFQPRQGPGSNHYGAVVGGCGLAVLAIKDDPGTDSELLGRYAAVVERGVVRSISAGWGDGGYYKEGWGASQVGTQGGLLCFLQALKIGAGHDYLNVDRTNASYVTMVPRGLMLIGPPAIYPYRSNMGGTYGSFDWYKERAGFSHGGHFAEGFGAIADKYKPGLLWIFNHTVEPVAATRTFDTTSLYPHRPMLALINWPTFSGIQEQNPAQAMPKVTRDHLYEYSVFRNRWQDQNDIVTTALINVPDGTRPRGVMVWGLGQRLELGEPPKNAAVKHFEAGADGSGTICTGNWAMAVDYSAASGADALVIIAGTPRKGDPGGDKVKVKMTVLAIGETSLTVLSLSAAGKHPEPRLEGSKLIVGGQTVTYADGKLTLGTFQSQK